MSILKILSVIGKKTEIGIFIKFRNKFNKLIKKNYYFTYTNELAQVLHRQPCIVQTPHEAIALIKSNDTIFISGAATTPTPLVIAMCQHAKTKCLTNIMVCHMHTEGPAPYGDAEFKGTFLHNSFFMGGNVRKACEEGRADHYPIFLQDIPELFYNKIVCPDVALITVSPPDKHGFCSLGTSVDCVYAGCKYAKAIVAAINKQMPRTFGDSIIHQSHIDYAIEVDTPIHLSHKTGGPTEPELKIGNFIASNLIEDGCTLQMGIGGLPDATLLALANHKDLGIHSELIADGVVDLVCTGVVTNSRKPVHKGRMVGSFLLGSKKLYDFVDDNPMLEMLRVDYVNKYEVIVALPKMRAINSCIEIDLTGQICADSIGTRIFSGFGGQVDFMRATSKCTDGLGKSIMALNSVTNKGESKIVPFLKQGSGVTTVRGNKSYVVTEYGIADLFGKTLRQRAAALIGIAHPTHKEKLEKAAFERLKVMPQL